MTLPYRTVSTLALAAGLVGSTAMGAERFERLPVEDRLGGGSVAAILQDARGFIWLGTNRGLKRFDGYEFLVFSHDTADPRSIASDDVRALLEDRTGALWVGTGHGLQRFDRTTRSFERIPVKLESDHGLSDPRVTALSEDRFGHLWVATENGLNRLDPTSGVVEQFFVDRENPDRYGRSVVNAVLEDRAGALWIGALGALERRDPHTGTWTRYQHDPDDPWSLPWPNVNALYEDAAGTLWVGTDGGGLTSLDRASGVFTRHVGREENHDSPHKSVGAIVEDLDGTLWIGTFGGLRKFDRTAGTFTSYDARPGQPHGLSSAWTRTLFVDRGGNLWIGTYDGTSLRLRWRKEFENVVHDPALPNGFPEGSVTAFAECDAGEIWVGTWGGGLARYDPTSGALDRYRHHPDRPNGLSRNWVGAVSCDRSGDVWIGTNLVGGLNRLDRRSGAFTHFRHEPSDPQSLSSSFVISILEDREGVLWLGTSAAGLNRLDSENRDRGRFHRYQHDPKDATSLRGRTVASLFEDREGQLWIGTSGGLNRYDRAADEFIRYDEANEDPNDGALTVHVIHESRTGTLWIGTNRGLRPVDEVSGRVGSNSTLSDRAVFGLLEDDHGTLWLHTSRGLTRYDPHRDRARHFYPGDGWRQPRGSPYSSNAYLRSSSGHLYFGGANGLTTFAPDAIRDNPHRPPVVFTDFAMFHESVTVGPDSVLKEPIDETSSLLLSHRDDVISIEFAALDFSAPDKNQYSYRLEGFDTEWVDAGTSRRATYTNLPPGSYTLRVRGSNNDGVWSEHDASIVIRVTPPLWLTWWFRGLTVASVLGLAVVVHGARVEHLERNAKRLRERVAEATTELAHKNRHLREQISQREEAEAALQYRIGIEILIASASNSFLDLAPESADDGIRQALQMIGSFAEVDRSYVFLLSADGHYFSNTHEWCANEVVSVLDVYRDLSCEEFPWFIGKLRALEVVHVLDPSELPPEEVALRRYLELDGVQSILNVPMAVGGELIGFLGFDSLREPKAWSREDVRLLRMVGEMFVAALERRRADADLRSAHARAVRSEKIAAMGQLTAGILHELNTPVGVLAANADLVLRCTSQLKEAPSVRREQILEILEGSSTTTTCASKRIVQILDQLKQFTRLDGSPSGVIDIHESLDHTLSLLGAERRAGVTVRKCYGELPSIHGRAAELNQVFMAILERALRVADEPTLRAADEPTLRAADEPTLRAADEPTLRVADERGVVTITTRTANDEVHVTVADTGRGLTRDEVARVFDLSFGIREARIGAEMALAQASSIVQAHGGRIDVTSRPDKGSQFRIRLPAGDG